MSEGTRLAIAAAASYLLGAIPFGYLAAKSQGVDIFSVGSGNPGATNVARVLGRGWGGLVFVLDVLKGVLPTILARFLVASPVFGIPTQVLWFGAGLGAVLGHCFSPFLSFRGGKGIASLLGAGFGACPVVAGIAFGIFLAVFLVTRYVSLASMIAVAAAIPLGWFVPGQARELTVVYIVLTAFVVYKHRSNIRRLAQGTEPKFKPGPSRKKGKDAGSDISPPANPAHPPEGMIQGELGVDAGHLIKPEANPPSESDDES